MSQTQLETRDLVCPVEIRADDDPKSRRLTGTVIQYGKVADLRYFKERFQAGAFKRSLADKKLNIRALLEHDSQKLLGSTGNGSLQLRDSAQGLTFDLQVAKTTYGDDALELVRSGEIRGMSFGFRVIESGERFEKDGETVLRTVVEAELREITVTSVPVYGEASSVQARSIDQAAIDAAKALVAVTDRPEYQKRSMQLRRQLASN